MVLAVAAIVPNAAGAGPTETIRVEVSLRSGGGLAGAVVDHSDHGLVMVRENTPYVFAWTELEGGNAYAVRRQLVTFQRRGEEHLTADDYVVLGSFALRMGRAAQASHDFRRATLMDSSKSAAVNAVIRAHRISQEKRNGPDSLPQASPEDELPDSIQPAESMDDHGSLSVDAQSLDDITLALGPLTGREEEVLAVYERFGEKVREVLGDSVVRLQSDHFLIFTDFAERDRPELIDWCEQMYAALARQFRLKPDEPVFLAKCPIFAFRSKQRFRRFAKHFDGYDSVDALGYTRSIQANGHVHVVLLRQGSSREDFAPFACTLVHEGTHAFVHRLFTSRLIPHWVNEGLAELTAERVLGDRCPAKENAALLAKQFATYGWPIHDFLARSGPLEVHEYPLAHSVIAYLESQGASCLTAFVRALKQGDSIEAALAGAFDELAPARLETDWREWARKTAPPSAMDVAEESARLPWSSDR